LTQSREILQKYWGFDKFRPLQEEIADSSIYGSDVLALLPTGGGKSICFQVPGLAREGICIVISPLIALMNDQVETLKRKGLRAKALTGGMSYRDLDITLDNARFGGLDFLYLSPERLQTKLFIERFKLMKVALIVVDEAHCISEWGHDFRPPYRKISNLREIHKDVPFIALTATATEKVKLDIIQQLKLKNVKQFEGAFSRNNISYEVYPSANKLKAITDILPKFEHHTGIIYCQRRKSVKELAQYLISKGYKVGIYHGGLEKEQREDMMKRWLSDQVHIMIATNAFGMGIDKPDVRFVIHFEFPNNPEAYFQEAGRAGRDGLESRTFVFFEEQDVEHTETQIEKSFPPISVIKNTYRALCNFLRIAIGSGENESYPLEISQFCSSFKLDVFETYQSLKFLELNGNLVFSENFYQPTKLKFAVSNKTLYSFQIQHDKIGHLITLISRSYPGVFDQFFDINEKEFCKRLQLSRSELVSQLNFLEKNGIIELVLKSDKPMVTLLHERLPDNYLEIKQEIYTERKKLAKERWKVMKKLLLGNQCRAQFLIAYFGQESEKCGKCDFCRNEASSSYTLKEIVGFILEELTTPKSLNEIKEKFEVLSEKQILQALSFLKLEEKIIFKEQRYCVC
jgi:ATP-dependent DNA helicase RecQ